MAFAHSLLLATQLASLVGVYAIPPASSALTQQAWDNLSAAVQGKLFQGVPLASPCFGFGRTNEKTCSSLKAQYTNETFRSQNFGAYINTQWESCQTTSAQCLLDSTDLTNPLPTTPPRKCGLGSVPSRHIDVRSANDVAAAFTFSKQTGVPLVIKNTGHDYKGRSSGPDALALWMHNLKDMSYHPDFVADGCSATEPAVTLGAGVQWADAYQFADAHNITLVGGSDRSVGAVGGWLQGGGHSILSNSMGLGVDRVLQFKVVTPDGVSRVANACQNEDLFFALRGGGGTFGVVLEATMLASPAVELQAVIVSWGTDNTTLTAEMWRIMADNALAWATEGWGGLAQSNVAIFVNPTIGAAQAALSMAPLIYFGCKLQQAGVEGASTTVTTFPTFLSFYDTFTLQHVASVGTSLAIASRLVNKANFATPAARTALVSSMLATNAAAGRGMIVLIVAPFAYSNNTRTNTSVTPAWRSSVYHVTAVAPWAWNATGVEKRAGYTAAGEAVDSLRQITPDAAYQNEADVYEPNHEVAFWGTNYPALLKIKQKYDPDHLLDCWHCVGWNPKSPRFSCYL
ncbi:FAD-binding domain-containing protein [Mycena sp. CBHHK59/15]|nr:FAD-binding domain-containing protein [Mycena sp. CBHHK59/15]